MTSPDTKPSSNPDRIPAMFSWNQQAPAADGRETVPYARSEAVRELLVLLALSSSKVDMPKELGQAVAIAFGNVCHDLRHGLLALDYHPLDMGVMDIPSIDHPHYMQALLYWSNRADCTLDTLVDAHARLGSAPGVDSLLAAVKRISREALQGDSRTASTQRPRDVARTMLMFSDARKWAHA